jgi:hypothetical protein
MNPLKNNPSSYINTQLWKNAVLRDGIFFAEPDAREGGGSSSFQLSTYTYLIRLIKESLNKSSLSALLLKSG